MSAKLGSMKDIALLLADATDIFSQEPNYIDLPLDRPIVFFSDTHGDYDATEEVFRRYRNHTIVDLGDDTDRERKKMGSLINLRMVLRKKTNNPRSFFRLRGNHDFKDMALRYGFISELEHGGYQNLIPIIEELWSQLPYIAVTNTGLLALHGGPPDIKVRADVKNLPKNINSYLDNVTISQIVWNDPAIGHFYLPKGIISQPNYDRDFVDDHGLVFGQQYFNEKMRILGKRALVRGHNHYAKHLAFDDRLLTICTSSAYNAGKKYVAIVSDPQKEIRSCRELKIVKI